MSHPADTAQRAFRVDGALSARVVLDQFNERGRALLGAEQADAAARIAGLLAHEADLSATWHGLPGTDHPRHWQAEAGDEAGLSDPRSEHRRLDVALPLWWTLPLALRERAPQRVLLPLAGGRDALRELALRHLPAAWWDARVRVSLDVEARVYWGARGAVHPRARGRLACAQRADAGLPALRLFALAGGEAIADAPGPQRAELEVALHLHPGVGWLVALPVLRLERDLARGERVQRRLAGWWQDVRAATGHPSPRDRDPSFARRLCDDESWWSGRLRAPARTATAIAADARAGASLRPASRAALAPRAKAPAQVILIHGGLSSVRCGFEAAWSEAVPRTIPAANVFRSEQMQMQMQMDDGAPSASRPMPKALADAALALAHAASARAQEAARTGEPACWPGLATLDERATWRFDHDTFQGIDRNVAGLVAAVGRHCVAAAAPDATRHLVLLAHARGGNVARFALPALRAAFGGRGWTFAALTLGSPHLGTDAFASAGRRWHALATAAGGLRHLGEARLGRDALAELVGLERGLAYDLPRGFRDLEPSGLARLLRGRAAHELPPGLWLVGSHWAPGPGSGSEMPEWDWLYEDARGDSEAGDGLVRCDSALAGRPAGDEACATRFDASPVFHTHYLLHAATRARIARMLRHALQETPE